MKKNVFGRKLSRDKEERKALFKSLMTALILEESIQTTEAKAKAIRADIEKLVTKAKNLEKGALLVLEKNLPKKAFDKMVKEIGPRFAKRNGGYTRIVKIGERFGDNSPLVIIEWVEKGEVILPVKKEKVKKEAKEEPVKKSKKEEKVKKEKPTKKTEKKVKK